MVVVWLDRDDEVQQSPALLLGHDSSYRSKNNHVTLVVDGKANVGLMGCVIGWMGM